MEAREENRQDHRAINVPLARAIPGQPRLPAVTRTPRSEPMTAVCGHPSKLVMRVRFPSPAPLTHRSSPGQGLEHLFQT